MASLLKAGRRFDIPVTIIAGGSGIIRATISESDQKQIPANNFISQRHVLRAPLSTPLRSGMVIRTPAGIVYIVGDNGPSELPVGTLWQSWRLFTATGQYQWTRRTKEIDVITKLEREGVPQDMGLIWAAMEPMDRALTDFHISASFEQTRFISGEQIQVDDLLNGKKVTRADLTLGVIVGITA